MRLKLKCSEDNFGFVEVYKPYSYTVGAVTIMAVAEAGGGFAEPFVYRGGEFIPASQIEEEMGISKYIRAKKPFYSLLGTGNVIVEMRVSFDLHTHEYLDSTYKLYGIVKDSLVSDKDGNWSVELRRYTSSSPDLEMWLMELAKKTAKFGSDREAFLKSRLVGLD